MARGAKRAGGRLGLILVVALLAGCHVGGDEPADVQEGDWLEAQRGPSPKEAGGRTRWVQTIRSAGGSDAPVATGHDAQGNILTLANHLTPIDFGQGVLDAPSGSSVLAISKYSPGGALLWVLLLQVPRTTAGAFVRGQSLAVDSRGHVLLTGVHSGGLNLGGGALPAGPFLARLDEDGHPLWARRLPTTATELAVSPHGDITLAGALTGKVDFGGGELSGNNNPFLVRYGPEGALRWVYVDTAARGVPMDLAQDDAGDLYLAGGRFLPPSPLLSPFLTRVSAEGEVLWTRQLEGASGLMMSVAAHGDHVAVSGSFTGSFVFLGRPLAATTTRGFALTYGKDGKERWGFLLGSTWGMVMMDQGAGLVIAGRYAGGEDFGLGLGEPQGFPGSTNLYVLRLQRSTGKAQWMRTYRSASALPVDLSVTRHGASTLVGTFRAEVDFGAGGTRAPGPGANAFVLQLEK
ncbi:hypothetical protein [Archangium sp.]|uniref:hypothetical protein n=1 Tax=Archangium sp. TaxID=1872627 RepID=UPI00286B6BD1|nr:hypothetical protein [Archangium sp.]